VAFGECVGVVAVPLSDPPSALTPVVRALCLLAARHEAEDFGAERASAPRLVLPKAKVRRWWRVHRPSPRSRGRERRRLTAHLAVVVVTCVARPAAAVAATAKRCC